MRKKIVAFIGMCLFLLTHYTIYAQPSKRNCFTYERLEQSFLENPSARTRYADIQTQLERLQQQKRFFRGGDAEVVIPVVVHILLPTEEQDLVTDMVIKSQLDTLNYYYGSQPLDDSLRVYEPFRTAYGRSNIRFCLSQRTPEGTATNGINRVVTNTLYTTSGSHPGEDIAWNPIDYLNIWVVNMGNRGYLGYSYPPGTWLPASPKNGFVNDYRAFGAGPDDRNGGYHFPDFNAGKTAVHEIGHFFNLHHTWGPNNNGNPNCTLSDGCNDTPPTSEPYGGCNLNGPILDICSPSAPGIMWQNHMDYADDRCMLLFTNDQVARMHAALSSPDRIGLTTSNACTPLVGFAFDDVDPGTSNCPALTSITTNLSIISLGGYTEPVTLSAISGVPTGATISFGSNPVVPGNSTSIVLNNTGTLSAGVYTVAVQGVATGSPTITKNISFEITADNGPSIITQPSNQTICDGENVTFSVVSPSATSYQWQIYNGINWVNVSIGSGGTTANYTLSGATTALNNNQYRCVVGVQCGVSYSNSVTLKVNSLASITTQPVSNTVCEGSNAGFSVVANTAGGTYQWQVNTGAGWADIATGGTAANYTVVNPSVHQNQHKYRVKITAACNTVISNEVLLTVNAYPVISFDLPISFICTSDKPINLVASPANGLFSGNGITNAEFNPAIVDTGFNFITYTAESQGCVSVKTQTIEVDECWYRFIDLSTEPAVNIFPIPNKGLFNVEVKSTKYEKLKIRVFNPLGQLVHSREVSGLMYGDIISVNLGTVAAGVYHVHVSNYDDTKTYKRSIIIER